MHAQNRHAKHLYAMLLVLVSFKQFLHFFTVPPKGLLNKFQGFEHEVEAFQADEVSLQTNALQTD